jgi:sugar/nucleoside kinase (ribokinase family)
MLAPMAAPDVLAVGDVMLDVSVAADALAGGHVAGKVRIRPGGSAANAAVWAAHTGAAAAVVGRVGADFAGKALRQALAVRAVEPLLVEDLEAPTGTVLLLGETVVAERGATARLAPGDLPTSMVAPAVLVSGYALLHDDTEAAALAALDRASGPWVAVDAASARLLERYGSRRFLDATAAATVLLLNEDEALALAGATGEAAARALAGDYRMVCVKQGPFGALAAADGCIERAGGRAGSGLSRNPTGAGDAFAGALLAALARGAGAREALQQACAAGAASVAADAAWPAPC